MKSLALQPRIKRSNTGLTSNKKTSDWSRENKFFLTILILNPLNSSFVVHAVMVKGPADNSVFPAMLLSQQSCILIKTNLDRELLSWFCKAYCCPMRSEIIVGLEN